jgi:hypothetical protein
MSVRRRELLAALAAPAVAKEPSDADVLRGLLALEQEASLVYGTLRAGRDIPARSFRAHSREHVRALATALRNRGGKPPPPKARVGLATPEQALALEERATRAYLRATSELGDKTLLPVLGAIMANHGQHAVVLRQALGREPLAGAFAGR